MNVDVQPLGEQQLQIRCRGDNDGACHRERAGRPPGPCSIIEPVGNTTVCTGWATVNMGHCHRGDTGHIKGVVDAAGQRIDRHLEGAAAARCHRRHLARAAEAGGEGAIREDDRLVGPGHIVAEGKHSVSRHHVANGCRDGIGADADIHTGRQRGGQRNRLHLFALNTIKGAIEDTDLRGRTVANRLGDGAGGRTVAQNWNGECIYREGRRRRIKDVVGVVGRRSVPGKAAIVGIKREDLEVEGQIIVRDHNGDHHVTGVEARIQEELRRTTVATQVNQYRNLLAIESACG